jgi:hypothetical protein
MRIATLRVAAAGRAEMGHHLIGDEDLLSDEELEQAIEQAKAEVCGVLSSGRHGHSHLH